LIQEVSKFATCCRRKNTPRYIHWISTSLLRDKKDQSDVNEGRFREIKKKIDSMQKGTKNQIENLRKEVADKIDKLTNQNDVLRRENKDFKEEIINLLSKLGQSERPREEHKEEAKHE